MYWSGLVLVKLLAFWRSTLLKPLYVMDYANTTCLLSPRQHTNTIVSFAIMFYLWHVIHQRWRFMIGQRSEVTKNNRDRIFGGDNQQIPTFYFNNCIFFNYIPPKCTLNRSIFFFTKSWTTTYQCSNNE